MHRLFQNLTPQLVILQKDMYVQISFNVAYCADKSSKIHALKWLTIQAAHIKWPIFNYGTVISNASHLLSCGVVWHLLGKIQKVKLRGHRSIKTVQDCTIATAGNEISPLQVTELKTSLAFWLLYAIIPTQQKGNYLRKSLLIW